VFQVTSGSVKLLWGTAALSLVASGCSFAMRTAPSDPSERTPEAAQACTSSYLVPALDSVSAAVGGYNIAVSAAADDKVRIYGGEVDKGVGLGLGIAQLAAFGIAATYGYIEATRCNELRHEQRVLTDDEVAARPADPPPGPGMPPPPPADVTPEKRAAELPEWSAFRREPLPPTPPPDTRYHAPRYAPP
jgi:hypothetical protein